MEPSLTITAPPCLRADGGKLQWKQMKDDTGTTAVHLQVPLVLLRDRVMKPLCVSPGVAVWGCDPTACLSWGPVGILHGERGGGRASGPPTASPF